MPTFNTSPFKGSFGLEAAQVRLDHVGDVGEVAGLRPVAVDRRAAPLRINRAKSEITPLYGLDGSWRGPKMLK